MKKLMILAFLIIAFAGFASANEFRINEIMYNPPGDDNNKEFIEIYMPYPENLSGYIIADSSSNDTLILLQYANSSYAIIVEEGYNYSSINASVYSAGATIGNNLDNTADLVYLLLPNTTLVASAQYNGTLANGNGYSMEYYNGSWHESIDLGGTPGFENSVPIMNITNSTNSSDISNSSNISTNQSENITDDIEDDNCTIYFSVLTEKILYENDESVKINFNVTPKQPSFTIEYWTEDLFGRIAKQRYATANSNQKSWTPNIDEEDKSFWVKSILNFNCSEGLQSISSEKLIVVKGQEGQASSGCEEEKDEDEVDEDSTEETDEEESKASVSYDLLNFPETIYPGEEFESELQIRNDGKEHDFSVWSYVYKGSKCYSGEREGNKESVTLNPSGSAKIQLSNVVDEIDEGGYKLKIKILKDDLKTAYEITKDVRVLFNESKEEKSNASVINPDLQELVNSTIAKQANQANANESSANKTKIKSITGNAASNVVYRSSSERVKDFIGYFIMAAMLIMIIILVIKVKKLD